MLLRIVLLACLAVASSCPSLAAQQPACSFPARGQSWQPPRGGVIQDAKTAVSVARLFWLSMHSDINPVLSSDSLWQDRSIAVLTNGIWKVSDRPDSDNNITGLVFRLCQADGRVIDIYMVD